MNAENEVANGKRQEAEAQAQIPTAHPLGLQYRFRI
jgi:hypothetical protein